MRCPRRCRRQGRRDRPVRRATRHRRPTPLTAAGSEALPVVGDMTVKADADRAVAETLERFGRVDILINAIGGGAGAVLHNAEDYPEKDWDWIFDLNLRSTLLPSQAVARAMIAAGTGGRILNLSSVRGQLGLNAGYSAYVAVKGAINALTRQHATEWAKHGITVNAISPTFVRTAAGREHARRQGVLREARRPDPARPNRRARRPHRRHALLLLRRLVVRHRPDAHARRRASPPPSERLGGRAHRPD